MTDLGHGHDQEGVINEAERDENRLTDRERERLVCADISGLESVTTAVSNRTLKRLLAIEQRWDKAGQQSDPEDVAMLRVLDHQDLFKECVRRGNITRRIWTGAMKIYGQSGYSSLLDYVKG